MPLYQLRHGHLAPPPSPPEIKVWTTELTCCVHMRMVVCVHMRMVVCVHMRMVVWVLMEFLASYWDGVGDGRQVDRVFMKDLLLANAFIYCFGCRVKGAKKCRDAVSLRAKM